MTRALFCACALLVLSGAAAAQPAAVQHYRGPHLSFAYPAGWRVSTQLAPPGAVVAIRVEPAPRVGTPPVSMSVLVGQRVSSGIDAAATAWHAALVRNRVGWGMHADGGPPREVVRIGARRYLRYRDHIGGMMGQNEQVMTCAVFGGRLSCVVTVAPPAERELMEKRAADLLPTLTVKRF